MKLITKGYTNINKWTQNIKEIASILGRSYWGLVDKVRRLKIQNKI